MVGGLKYSSLKMTTAQMLSLSIIWLQLLIYSDTYQIMANAVSILRSKSWEFIHLK